MQFLTRLLMKSVEFASPTIVLITDRTDLDDQLSAQMCNAKNYIGDETVVPVTSREDLREKLAGRNSGGVFLTTIHKFTEDTELLSERSNIICISDEAHRSQVNLDQKVIVDKENGKVRKNLRFRQISARLAATGHLCWFYRYPYRRHDGSLWQHRRQLHHDRIRAG
ncbi:type I site-specific deoxyribonuclease, HsdR family [Klebsiella pneumoniae]|uniref:Type I site-specific deoxyribonuclease, HsdR family n=1 Tax=Klebsiella pneumoniae TaxID=573 RepID=A0A377ZLZ2_KLEPN|nr:type I site-specific deoxyribonuclease, HsdR family [Klebsiella pneumoniae]